MGYAFILGAMVGLFFGYFWGEKRGIGRGFVNGWLARHRGEDGIPDQYADYMSTINRCKSNCYFVVAGVVSSYGEENKEEAG